MYVTENFQTKKALRDAIRSGKSIGVFQPNGDLTGAVPPQNGVVSVEGPYYPQRHSWYARVKLQDGAVISVVK